MAQSILDIYNARQSELGTDTISFNAGQAAITPYSLDDTLNIDEQIMTADKFHVGRGGELPNTKYSDLPHS